MRMVFLHVRHDKVFMRRNYRIRQNGRGQNKVPSSNSDGGISHKAATTPISEKPENQSKLVVLKMNLIERRNALDERRSNYEGKMLKING